MLCDGSDWRTGNAERGAGSNTASQIDVEAKIIDLAIPAARAPLSADFRGRLALDGSSWCSDADCAGRGQSSATHVLVRRQPWQPSAPHGNDSSENWTVSGGCHNVKRLNTA